MYWIVQCIIAFAIYDVDCVQTKSALFCPDLNLTQALL